MVAGKVSEAFCPLKRRPEYIEIQVEFYQFENVGFCFFQRRSNLVMFMALRVNREALNVLKYEPKGLVRFGEY